MTPLLELLLETAQPRVTRDEAPALYMAVLRVRNAGHVVYRCGRDMHLVDGRRRSSAWLVRFARRYPWCNLGAARGLPL